MKKLLFSISVLVLAGCMQIDKVGQGYLIVENKSSVPIFVVFEVVVGENGTSICIAPQTTDTVFAHNEFAYCFNLVHLTKFEIAACDNPEEIIYAQNPIDKTKWIIEEKFEKKGFCYYSSNTFVFTDELIECEK